MARPRFDKDTPGPTRGGTFGSADGGDGRAHALLFLQLPWQGAQHGGIERPGAQGSRAGETTGSKRSDPVAVLCDSSPAGEPVQWGDSRAAGVSSIERQPTGLSLPVSP